ncbi:MAG: hypothetical protein R3223_04010 [Longimicrobiales bacterium]|nr:hypothetical protein [Longimicrobiales bacterium]
MDDRRGRPAGREGADAGNGSPGDDEDVLTLEPLLEAVREGVETAGWELSGLQKTTSYQFEGRWEGDSTRSAYVFFHRSDLPEDVSIDVYLDETSRGLKGNLALVLDAPPLGEMGRVEEVVATLGRIGSGVLPEEYRRPLTLRFRIPDVGDEPAGAGAEVRFKIHIPSAALSAGRTAVVAVARAAVDAFEELLDRDELRELRGE